MRTARSLTISVMMAGLLAAGSIGPAFAGGAQKLSGTRFEMNVPGGWAPGYKDLDNLLMIYFKNPKTNTALEGVYLRKVQTADFNLAQFKKWRIEAENKRYSGKGYTVVKEGDLTIAGEKGNYILTTWKDGGKTYVKHTAQYLKNGGQYMIVLHGERGKVNKKIFDEAVKSFSLAK